MKLHPDQYGLGYKKRKDCTKKRELRESINILRCNFEMPDKHEDAVIYMETR